MQIADQINLAIAIATALSVVVSAIMVGMTYAILRANRATVEVMRAEIEAASRPYVQIAPVVRPMTTAVELRVKNIGSTSANRLRLSLDRDFQFDAQEGPANNIRNYTVFTKEIQMLAPGAELRFLLGVGHRILSNPTICPLQFTVGADYGFEGKTVSEKTVIDLEPFGKSNRPIDPVAERLDNLVAEIKAIREELQNSKC